MSDFHILSVLFRKVSGQHKITRKFMAREKPDNESWKQEEAVENESDLTKGESSRSKQEKKSDGRSGYEEGPSE